MKLFLIRHGRSRANLKGLVTGTPSDKLTDEGVRQSTRMAAWLTEQGLSYADRYFTSNWARAKETASLMFPNAIREADGRLGETNAGKAADWELQKFLEFYPNFYDSHLNRYPEGESHFDLNSRVLGWLFDLSRQPCKTCIAVCHSGPINCILQHISRIGMNRFPAYSIIHASLSTVEIKSEGDEITGRILAYNLGPNLETQDDK